MLSNSARRTLQRTSTGPSNSRIGKPWVCSACLRVQEQKRWHTRRVTTTVAAQRQISTPSTYRATTALIPSSPHNSRSLATASDTHHATDDPIPFLTSFASSPQPSKHQDYPVPFSQLRAWDATPFTIHEHLAQPTPRAFTKNLVQQSGGNALELLQNLRASLVVGRWERAAGIVQRLATMFTPTAPELLDAHKIYIGAMIEAVALGRSDVSLQGVQKWFWVEMTQAGVKPDAETMALMCRLAFAGMESSSARDRVLRRYMQIAEEAGVLEGTLTSGIFLESEWEALLALRVDVPVPGVTESQKAYIEEMVQSTREPIERSNAFELPGVRSQEQRGLGLKTVRKTLRVLNDPSSVAMPDVSDSVEESEDLRWATARQIQLEGDVQQASAERWREDTETMIGKGVKTGRKREVKKLMHDWYVALVSQITKDNVKHTTPGQGIKTIGTAEEQVRLDCAPYLASLKPENVAALVVSSAIEVFMKRPNDYLGLRRAPISLLSKHIGLRIANQSTLESRSRFERDHAITASVSNYRKGIMGQKTGALPTAVDANAVPAIAAKLDQFTWPIHIKTQIGADLLAKLIDSAKIRVPDAKDGKKTKLEPAFTYKKILQGGKPLGVLAAHSVFEKMLSRDSVPSNLGSRLPMLVEPKPWAGYRNGGYLREPVSVMRADVEDPLQALYAKAAAEKGDLDQIFAGLSALGRTGWRVNRRVLTTMLEAWNTGKKFGKIPEADFIPEFPPTPASDASARVKYVHRREVTKLQNEAMGHHSQRCYLNLQLEIARAFADETFYFPHNIDFRGRAYPIPPHFNHMGADNARGLLIFAKGKALGDEGLRWLKVHLANLAGFDKASLKDRENFANEHLDDIRDSATNPLGGRKWWQSGEDMWQLLAACYELSSAYELPDPTKYVSHLAVHQDGTCNGLQHYAALGGDAVGAAQVNLEPGDRPADVYSGVADLVRAEVEKDVAAGVPEAKHVHGKITRKVVKQTVMTNVYGVTYIGARDQVLKQLDALMPAQDNFAAAGYVAKKIFESLGIMFTGAQAIQKWLGECAALITTMITKEQVTQIVNPESAPSLQELYPGYRKDFIEKWHKSSSSSRKNSAVALSAFRQPVIWTTPLKLPVVQPYRVDKDKHIPTILQEVTYKVHDGQDPVSKRKQCQGFPPNFIHSLDATHMLLSALKCEEMGFSFAAVHDSFWTHAADVPVMNNILRDAFVRMHGENIIGRLADELKARYGGGYCLTSVALESPLGKEIRAWRAAKQSSMKAHLAPGTKTMLATKIKKELLLDELIMEVRRSEATTAADEAGEVEIETEEIVTPTALYLKHGGSAAVEQHDGSEILAGSPLDEVNQAEAAADIPDAATADDLDMHSSLSDAPDSITNNSLNTADKTTIPVTMGRPKSKTKKSAPVRESRVYFWAPVEFPAVPPRGDWDITRLKDSTYFFS